MNPTDETANRPKRRLSPETRRLALVVIAVFTLQGLLLTGYKFFQDRAGGSDPSLLEQLVNEMTGAFGGLLLFPVIFLVCARVRPTPGTWWKAVLAHSIVLPLTSIAHTLFLWTSRAVLYPALGVDARYGNLPVRFAQEFFSDVWSYLVVTAAIYGFFFYRDARARELETARLQTELGRARLRDLQARLNPHFLFNTLNAISAHVGDDPAGAERMIEQLSALLRRSLSASGARETTVAEEVESLELYLAIMRERLGGRLTARVDVDAEAALGVVPTLLLQPLVENAIEHGIGPRASGGTVTVRGVRRGDRLELRVEDDGVGLPRGPEDALGAGFGLSSTAERVRALYGDRGHVELTRLDPGTRVTVTVPWKAGAATARPRGASTVLEAS